MREKILHTASGLFLNLGFKSVTMDDIADKMAISKKTIYEYYENKSALIEATIHFVFERISTKINNVCKENLDDSPIIALFKLNAFIQDHIKEENAPEYQLQKYYPKIAKNLHEKKFKVITEGISENLERGIALGLYRADINIPIIARFYYVSLSALKNSDIFQEGNYRIGDLMNAFSNYHLRAIVTNKGLKELDNYLDKNEN